MKMRLKYILLSIITVAALLFCGAGRDNIVMLDSDKHILYENITADAVIEDMLHNKSGLTAKYNGGFYVVWGNIAEVSDNGKSFKIEGLDGVGSKSITCKCSVGEVVDAVKKIGEDKSVKVYGKMSVSFFQKNLSLNVVQMEVVENGIYSENQYTDVSGKSYDLDNMFEVSLAEGEISYLIPQEWKDVSSKLENERLDGYRYSLNEINQATTKAESFFVFYFDYEKNLKNINDKSKTKEIQVAIINNILKKESGTSLDFARTNSETYYGAAYNYYCDAYTGIQNETYRVEFVFENAGEDGVLVYLYVVNNENNKRHIDDIMMVMKSKK